MRKRIFHTLLLSGFALYAVAQMRGYNLNFTLSKQNFCDTIAIDIDNDQIYIPVDINGKQYRFKLDTGSGQGAVYADTHINGMAELGNVISRNAYNQADTVKIVALPAFNLGNIVIDGYVMSMLQRPSVKGEYDAVIGFDLLNKGIAIKIDPQHEVMIITDRKHTFDKEEGYAIKYKLKWFVPHILVSPFIRHTDEVLFDLGSPTLYTMNKANFDKHVYKSKNVSSQVEGIAKGMLSGGMQVTDKSDEVAFLRLNRLKWDKFNLTQVRAITTQGSSRIGASILRYGSIIINPFQKLIVFQPYSKTDSIRVGNKQFGVAFIPHNGTATVGLILDQSEAYKQGMRQDDTLLRINDKAINSFHDFVGFPFVEGKKYKFMLRDIKGKNKEVVIER